MYEYIKGNITEITPAYVVVETGGIGYFINISLQTYSQISRMSEVRLLLQYIVREDAQILFGFFDEDERNVFRLLMLVSGIGANTARMMLSSITSQEVRLAIEKDDISKLKSVKGIGLKTAQRIVVDLKDKISKTPAGNIFVSPNKHNRDEAVSAMVTLGFTKSAVEKFIDALLLKEPDLTVESLIKQALKQL
ncbi:MAG: Holliday junction branch migration protein RuvA [Prevotellaceae bacterium]|jgi:Holliday junction DNA helicase RuvA|nr:Holliday junction branch migration protein RuvA [Prevotellaceae bacterium]